MHAEWYIRDIMVEMLISSTSYAEKQYNRQTAKPCSYLRSTEVGGTATTTRISALPSTDSPFSSVAKIRHVHTPLSSSPTGLT